MSMKQLLRWRIGDVTVTRIEESVNPVDRSHLLPMVTDELLAPYRAALTPTFLDDAGRLILSIHGLLVEAAGMRILVDTCIGDRRQPGMTERPPSPFLDNLIAAGYPPESIDVVLCTHLHFDHVGWNTKLADGRWVPTFPNARYLIGKTEWEHWNSEEGKANYATGADETVQPLFEHGQADLVDAGHRVCDSVWLEPTPGHTPGHVAVRIASGGMEALLLGDLSHHPLQWAEPDWSSAPDHDPVQSAATRRRLIAEHADKGTLVIGTHYPPPTAGHLSTTPDGTRFVPVD
jgi:glyoxylase-like metal-dependent hydrolase (beta-lactamase superfamily II)